MAVLHNLGLDVVELAKGFSAVTTPPGRGNESVVEGVKVIDDSYNANPVSMQYAVTALESETTEGKKIALLGEMLELGDRSDEAHQNIMNSADDLDAVMTFGKAFDKYPGREGHFDNVAALNIDEFVAKLSTGDVVLVKGSNKVFWTSGFVARLKSALALRQRDPASLT